MSARAIFNGTKWQLRLFGYGQANEILPAPVLSGMHLPITCLVMVMLCEAKGVTLKVTRYA